MWGGAGLLGLWQHIRSLLNLFACLICKLSDLCCQSAHNPHTAVAPPSLAHACISPTVTAHCTVCIASMFITKGCTSCYVKHLPSTPRDSNGNTTCQHVTSLQHVLTGHQQSAIKCLGHWHLSGQDFRHLNTKQQSSWACNNMLQPEPHVCSQPFPDRHKAYRVWTATCGTWRR